MPSRSPELPTSVLTSPGLAFAVADNNSPHPEQKSIQLEPHPLLLLPPGPVLLLLSSGLPLDANETLSAVSKASTPTETFEERHAHLRPRIERMIRHRWYDEFDAYELDNLIQAGIVHLWQAYCRNPDLYNAAGDGYWFATAKHGARNELCHEYRQRYRRRGSSASATQTTVEVVVSSTALLEAFATTQDLNDVDEALLSSDTIYSSETDEIRDADLRIDIPSLEATIYSGTNPQDHPMITQILGFMREGLTKAQMAERAGVKVSTIRVIIRRMQQACGASQEAKQNRKRPGDSLDAKIRVYRDKGLGGPEIARLIGTDWTFVYRRLHAMNLMENAAKGDKAH
ncbi:MAG: hypothetical protein ABI947_17015 [Chloroflexota bacterium]